MRTNFRFIARAIDWPSDVLPTPGGPTKHRMGPLITVLVPRREAALRLELLHGEVLDDPLLDLVEIVVILVEHLARRDRIEAVLGVVTDHGTSRTQSR